MLWRVPSGTIGTTVTIITTTTADVIGNRMMTATVPLLPKQALPKVGKDNDSNVDDVLSGATVAVKKDIMLQRVRRKASFPG